LGFAALDVVICDDYMHRIFSAALSHVALDTVRLSRDNRLMCT
jgi:hypothetical protein